MYFKLIDSVSLFVLYFRFRIFLSYFPSVDEFSIFQGRMDILRYFPAFSLFFFRCDDRRVKVAAHFARPLGEFTYVALYTQLNHKVSCTQTPDHRREHACALFVLLPCCLVRQLIGLTAHLSHPLAPLGGCFCVFCLSLFSLSLFLSFYRAVHADDVA